MVLKRVPLFVKKVASERSTSSPPFIGEAYALIEKFTYIPSVTLNAVPLTFNREIRRYAVSWSSMKSKLWIFSMLIMVFVEWAQITKELITAKADPNVSRGDWCLILFLFISWQFVISAHLNSLVHGDAMINHMNQLIRTREWFTQDQRDLPPSKDHKIVKALLWCCLAQAFFQCLTLAVERTAGPYLYSNVPEEYRNVGSAAIWTVYAYYRVITNFCTCLWHYFGGVLQVQLCTQVLEWRSQPGKSLEDRLKAYRMLQILSSRYDEAFGTIFIPQLTNFNTANVIIGIYGLLKFNDTMEISKLMNFPLMASIMIVQLLTFYPMNATLYEATKDERRLALETGLRHDLMQKSPVRKVLRNSASNVETSKRNGSAADDIVPRSFQTSAEVSLLRMIKAEARSCPIIGIPFGRLYKIKRSTVLSLFDFIVGNSVSALITYP